MLIAQQRREHILSTEYHGSGGPKTTVPASLVLTAVQSTAETVLDQPGYYITTTKVEGNANSGSRTSDLPESMNSEMRQFERENGIGSTGDSSDGSTTTKTTTSTTFVPAKYHSEVVPQTFTYTTRYRFSGEIGRVPPETGLSAVHCPKSIL